MTLRADTEEKKRIVLSKVGLRDTCCYFPVDIMDDECPEYDDRIYLDGTITFDTLAEIVDYLRACNLAEK